MPGSRRGRLLVALALAAAALAGCSGGTEPRGTVNVAMYDNFFAREVTRVPAGTRVRFPNRAARPTTPWPSTGAGAPPTGSGPTRRPRSCSTGRACTARINGVFWTGVRGYRASYVTAYNNKDYGIYAFDSVDGAFGHSYASGSPDSGFYIGQCHPCDAVIDRVSIVLGGGNGSRVERNYVLDHVNHGILVSPNLDEHLWTASGNRVVGNVVQGSGRADLALAAPAGAGNCFQGNQARTSIPVGLQAFQRCSGPRLPVRMDLSTTLASLGLVAEANTGAYRTTGTRTSPSPRPRGGAGAPVRPAVDVFATHRVDLARVPLPAASDQPPTVRKEPTVFGVPLLAPGRIPLAAPVRPLRLPAAVRARRRLDLARPVGPGPPRRPRPGRGVAWTAVALLVPFLGVIAYHVLGRPRLPAWLRAAVVGGGLVAYLVVPGVGALLGGIT
jgi:Right handed beta helix region